MAYELIKKELLVFRKLRLLGNTYEAFGLCVMRREIPYLGDAEYRRAAVWPKETPVY